MLYIRTKCIFPLTKEENINCTYKKNVHTVDYSSVQYFYNMPYNTNTVVATPKKLKIGFYIFKFFSGFDFGAAVKVKYFKVTAFWDIFFILIVLQLLFMVSFADFLRQAQISWVSLRYQARSKGGRNHAQACWAASVISHLTGPPRCCPMKTSELQKTIN